MAGYADLIEHCGMMTYEHINWKELLPSLDKKGFAIIPSYFHDEDCSFFIDHYQAEGLYRSTISMQRYRFGEGEYKYFQYPLPNRVQQIRETFYPPLAALANSWMSLLSIDQKFPLGHKELLALCHAKNQLRPTPLILHYEKGGFNTLHQDLYGEVYFPFQVVFPLSQYGEDYEGGEFVLVSQLPRAQSKAEVVLLNKEIGRAHV